VLGASVAAFRGLPQYPLAQFAFTPCASGVAASETPGSRHHRASSVRPVIHSHALPVLADIRESAPAAGAHRAL
jgi:hypothetical protein